MASKDSKWEFNCPQYFDFQQQDQLDDDDGADQFFDLLEAPGSRQGALREICNIQQISESFKMGGNRRSPRIRAQWNLKENNSPLHKKFRSSTSPSTHNKKRLSASYRLSTGLYNRAKSHWRTQRSSNATKIKPQPLKAKLKVHSMDTRQDSFKELDYMSTLRKYDVPAPTKKYVRITQPEPFKLSGAQNKPLVEKFKSTAEQLIAYQTKTPDRYRSKKHTPTKAASFSFDKPRKLLPTDICSPKLLTKLRRRSPACLSQKDVEEKEIEDMKKFKFHAQPVNTAIFLKRDIGVPKVEPKPNTTFAPFHLLSEERHEKYEAIKKPEEPVFKFQARPVPKGLLENVQGVPHMKTNFALRHRRHLEMSKADDIATQVFKGPLTRSASTANSSMASISSVASTISVKWDAKPTVIKPFQFDQLDKERRILKEKKIQAVLEEEKKLREFHANPLPKLTTSGIPPKKKKSPTKCEPFQVESELAGLKKVEKWKQEMEEILKNQKKLASFKAQPCYVTIVDPFVPVKVDRSLTEPKTFSLHTEARASEREEFAKTLKEKEARLQEILLERQKVKEEEEEKAIAQLRASTVHVARPVRHYKPMAKVQPNKLTKPLSPELQTRKRLRESK